MVHPPDIPGNQGAQVLAKLSARMAHPNIETDGMLNIQHGVYIRVIHKNFTSTSDVFLLQFLLNSVIQRCNKN